jgi:ERCC4-related helicase
LGEVEVDRGITVLVRFGQQYQSCERSTLQARQTVDEAIASLAWNDPIEIITKAQAAAITSLNDSWGIFSRSRINLLPHQLWVCHRVLRRWPARWLIADDVGLGKTIEAGLILWPLLSKQLVRRLLVLCPAKLVEQWQYRLREMFDIRLHRYVPDLDTPRSDYWNSHSQVTASLHTLRDDHGGRHERLLSAENWDLVIVDEAHHLNSDEKTGKTLGYQLLEKLLEHNKAESCIFFTGTPHRGKQYGFWSLQRLLRPDLFDPERPDAEQYRKLPEVLMRNNKQSVTDMHGTKLFAPVLQHPETYHYSPQEEHFYQTLTEFIATGRAYASSLSSQGGQQVMLVLIAMQKLASSSVAAIRRAIQRRLERLQHRSAGKGPPRTDLSALQRPDADLLDELQPVIEEVASEPDPEMALMKDEIRHLEELLRAAQAVEEETKVRRLIEVLETRFANEQVLFFTEYKATQALVMSALLSRFGDGCVSFINGDEELEGVISVSGPSRKLRESRTSAAARFNAGDVRFLISTEAGGEGIDLQHRCHSLIHVDLPWNPMRLHQRVGRLNRYGQEHPVEVVTLRNPDTVESLIWEKLNTKLRQIMLALGSVMDEPEDLLQLVLGMAGSAIFDEMFSESAHVRREHLADWFDSKSGTFGGQAAIDVVKALVGNAAKFDYQGLGDIPKADLPDLRVFFENALRRNGRKPMWKDDSLSFVTPEAWLVDRGVRRKYDGLVFSRSKQAGDVIGVGHRAFDQAIRQALESPASLASIRSLALPIVLFQIYDQVTEHAGTLQAFTAGVTVDIAESRCQLLNDVELLQSLNGLGLSRTEPQAAAPEEISRVGMLAEAHVRERLRHLNLPFVAPGVRMQLIMWPGVTSKSVS